MRTIKKIGVKSFAKFNLYYGGLIGLIFGLFGGIPVLLGSNIRTEDGMTIGAGFGNIFGLVLLVGAPLVYGLMGFISGYIIGFILNFVLKLTGGVDFEVEDKAVDSLPKEV